ncbi:MULTISPECIES: adenosylmethionine--8-amino-7-oxononanoate transaminase [unclassified Campylobacter]|uniref:adenosylmethionine--8-amino-7-oxononanoate transaminase n=1 Tax=unclassified Campylobacter TaxID=2593542 RepID=UPI001237CBD5|nr:MULTISPECIES: adenosylmethionine--8-amino-7-oxononanoate transaminase [unclassified Campylobacter]KAA6226479.1 adenosylmethionine--8-amino-7-oxononanoate transaminase [Campylobacter sp. LR185c]KAA6228614.1 adenosylmethionine--8-amino-7-oxononanoate transaminase [Campylobacter sp. LR196d]KAA6229167.1 adenosylmethionine--8-amino-7-oxononanoate transaminase [Campylobacter sp. LR286c]KAA6233958.1 adenosylmethionine--8-amino-7-oxononanoate transaminase [Campylobacter sp. LR291e]KAA6234197.1 aden
MNSKELKNLDLKHIWHPCSQMKDYENLPLIPIKKAKGVWLYDFDDKPYLDCVSSWWVNLFGHSNKYINKAIKRQLKSLEHVLLAGFSHESIIKLSSRLCSLLPYQKCFYADNGSSAVEVALKMSFHYFLNKGVKKSKFLSLENAYHGETLGALSVGDVALYKEIYTPLLLECLKTPVPKSDDFENELNALKNILQTHSKDLCAFILEPLVQCAGNMHMYSAKFIDEAIKLCHSFGVQVIFDEIATGFGRTGTMFGLNQCEEKPDFICLSKGITAGYLPLSVVMIDNKIYDCFYDSYENNKAFLHSHSYTGNALACAAANACLDIFEKKNIIEKNKILSEFIKKEFENLKEFEFLGNFRQRGMIYAFDIVKTNKNRAGLFVFEKALQKNILLRPLGNTIYCMPPYVIKKDEISMVVRVLKEIFSKENLV